jgi:tetratricopeptide (TPR) repeat protein
MKRILLCLAGCAASLALAASAPETLQLGVALQQENEFEAAADKFQEVVDMGLGANDDATAWATLHLAECHRAMRDDGAAQDLLEAFLQEGPAPPDYDVVPTARFKLCEIYWSHNKLADAAEILQRTVEDEAASVAEVMKARGQRVHILKDLHQWEKAAAEAGVVLEAYEQDKSLLGPAAWAKFGLASVAYNRRQYNDALAQLNECLVQFGHFEDVASAALYDVSRVSSIVGDREAHYQALQVYVNMYPAGALAEKVRRDLGDLYLEDGQTVEAILCWRAALDMSEPLDQDGRRMARRIGNALKDACGPDMARAWYIYLVDPQNQPDPTIALAVAE